ncbi:hypothetical protein Tco_0116542 [Tanacetum coccineum]
MCSYGIISTVLFLSKKIGRYRFTVVLNILIMQNDARNIQRLFPYVATNPRAGCFNSKNLVKSLVFLLEVDVLSPTNGHLTTWSLAFQRVVHTKQTLPPPDEIKLYVQVEREDVVTRIRHDQVIDVEENQILAREITPIMKTWIDIIHENVFCLGGNRNHVPACLCHMLYCIPRSEQYNLAFFVAKRMKFVTKQDRLILPYGMLLTRLFKHLMSENPELSNDNYVLYDRVMYPLTTQQEQKTRKDYGTKRCRPSTSVTSSSAFGQPSSSDHIDDDNDGNNEGTSRASTPSPTRFVNSLSNDIPQVFSNPPNIDPNKEIFYTRQTEMLNRQVQLRDEHQSGLRLIGKGIKNLLRGMKK